MSPLFASAFEDDAAPVGVLATAAGAPSNQQIIDAAKAAYHTHQSAVDALAVAADAYFTSTAGAAQVALLNAYDWGAEKIDGSLTAPVWRDAAIAKALTAVTADAAVLTVVCGILSAGEKSGATQGVGFGSPPQDLGSLTGETFIAQTTLSKALLGSVTLQFGLWMKPPGGISLDFYGLQAVAGEIALRIFLLTDLSAYGFSIGLGDKLGGSSSVMSGTTKTFM